MEVLYNKIDHIMYILNYDDFSKLCHVIKNFLELYPNFGKEDITFPPSSNSKAIKCVLMNLNHVCLLLIQQRTMNSQLIKIIMWKLHLYYRKINDIYMWSIIQRTIYIV